MGVSGQTGVSASGVSSNPDYAGVNPDAVSSGSVSADGGGVNPLSWVLITGTWNDAAFWNDTAIWDDGV